MENNSLFKISPIDGRYADKVSELAEYFSEFALIKARIFIEIEYFISLCEIPLDQLRFFGSERKPALRRIYEQFSGHDAERVKAIERQTNHDVKAVEYFIREKFTELGLSSYSEFIHFGLTSQDINNTSVPLILKNFTEKVFNPIVDQLLAKLRQLSEQWSDVPMLARTHGQPATPTRMGKELMVFVERIENQFKALHAVPFSAKFGGASGNFNAHHAAFPNVDWLAFSDSFVNGHLGLVRSRYTTQIEHYDNIAAYFDATRRINTILIDFCRDIWTYISMDYFRQKIQESEVGSSAMPHKVNPIDFENAEGNLGVANALCSHLSEKLPLSRLQRDLTDSTVLRNIGVPLAHTMIAIKSILKGLDKLYLNEPLIYLDLEKNWLVVAEGIQTILRREGYPEAYEVLKKLTRTSKPPDKKSIEAFIDNLELDDNIKNELKQITPFNYTGIRF